MSYPPPQGYPPAQGAPPPQGYYQTGQAPPPGPQAGYNYGQPPQPAQAQGYGAPQLSSQMAGMSLQTRAGDSPILATFAQGNIIFLESNASGKTLRITQAGGVEGIGGRGGLAQFRVHVRRPGVVALQNIHTPENWLAIYQGKTIGTGKGGPYCEFTVNEIEGRFACLESTQYPGQYVGVLPDGKLKPPESTRTGPHGRFIVIIHTYGSSPGGQTTPPQAHQQYPPPQQASPQQQHPQYPQAPQGQYPPPPQQAGPTAPPPQQYQQPGVYAPQPGYQPAPAAVPTGAQLPTGYKVLDAFRGGNIVQLISRSSGNPLMAKQGGFSCKGGQLGTNDCLWNVIVPSGCAPGVIMLQNVKWPGMYLAISKKGELQAGHGKKYCHLVPRSRSDNYVCFMSLENSGQYVGFGSHGNPVSPKSVGENDQDAQFFVRIDKQKHPLSQSVMTPFGRPSIANELSDGCVVQLYLKSNNMYLSINSNGIVNNTVNGNDVHTFFKVSDRGMGILSFHTYKYPGFRLRIQGGALMGKGAPDLGSDFRLKESQDGTVCMESVLHSGTCVGIQGPAGFQTNLNVFLVVIQKFGGSETITKTPLN